MKTAEELQRIIDELIAKIDNMMLRFRNGYLEYERSES
jgi:hypothetical protein